jgi:hypothetical protein
MFCLPYTWEKKWIAFSKKHEVPEKLIDLELVLAGLYCVGILGGLWPSV